MPKGDDAMSASVSTELEAADADSRARIVGLNVYSLLGNTAMAAQPVIVGALVDLLGFTPRQAGFVSAAELAGLAIGMGALVAIVNPISRRARALAAIVIVAMANAATMFGTTLPEILLLRFVNGVGAALAYSVFLTMSAATRRPERTFGVANAISILATGLLVLAGPYVLASAGTHGLFLGLSGIAIASLLALPLIPANPSRERNGTSSSSPAPLRIDRLVAFVLLMMFFLYTGHSAIWSYQERIGVAAGIPPRDIGLLIGSSLMLWGVLGSIAASVLGLRIGRVWPQIVSLGLSIAAAVALALSSSALAFGAASALVAISWFYGLPYQMGLLAAFDPYGRANIAGSLMTTGGAAAGPFIAALLIGSGSYRVLGVLAGLCYTIALVLVLPPAIRLARNSSTQQLYVGRQRP
jgi:predicted MFS family arabinose efflux permease